MPTEDANRWNLRYLAGADNPSDIPRSLLVDHADLLPSSGLALDIAMGLGGNAGYLLRRGLRVVGVDISEVAVYRAKKEFTDLMAVVADLERFSIPPLKFDVILNFLYLQRNLWGSIQYGLKPGGLLFLECLTDEMLSIHPEIDLSYLLKHAELLHTFKDSMKRIEMEILYYHEGWSSSNNAHRRATAALIARRVA
jgi:2-polyprenyl-3-methyl-5-hydroxy-6-metoxy-1,4-benzoquinol methylase